MDYSNLISLNGRFTFHNKMPFYCSILIHTKHSIFNAIKQTITNNDEQTAEVLLLLGG